MNAFQRLGADNCSKLKGCVYLDHAGAGLYSDDQIASVFEELKSTLFGNPHTRNQTSAITTDVIDHARSLILEHFRTTSEEYDVIFTSGATAALKLVGESFDFDAAIDDGGDEGSKTGSLVYLNDNHTSVIGMRELAAARHAQTECIDRQEVHSLMDSFSKTQEIIKSDHEGANLFVYPAESNFSGDLYPLEWIDKVQKGALTKTKSFKTGNGTWKCLLDAACFISTNPLDLSQWKPDFVTLSFYKMFGYPTGLGALLVRNCSAHCLKKCYFGGGTVSVSVTPCRYHISKETLHDRFEDGTVPFLSIAALRHGFSAIKKFGGMAAISSRTYNLAKYTYERLSNVSHENGAAVAQIYSQSDFSTPEHQGGIVAFNLLRPNGDYVAFTEVEEMCNLHNIMIRTGCFCNTGACQMYLRLSNEDLIDNFKAGHVCGDTMSLVDGRSTGAVRVSFGHPSTKEDADRFLEMINSCFVFRLPKISAQLGTKKVQSSNISISKMFIYPVKSCTAQEVESWKMTPVGLQYDRQWMVVASSGVPLNLKREPRLGLINPRIDIDNDLLVLECKGGSSRAVPLSLAERNEKMESASLCSSKICGKRVEGFDCGDEIGLWIDECLQRTGCRLIRQNTSATSPSGKTKNVFEKTNFANESKFTLITETSVDWLSERLRVNGFLTPEELDGGLWTPERLISRFRTNFVISGTMIPLAEDTWQKFSFSNVKFQNVKQCSRCQVIGVNVESGGKDPEPLRTLSLERGQKMAFGINFSHDLQDEVTISVGDYIKVLTNGAIR